MYRYIIHIIFFLLFSLEAFSELDEVIFEESKCGLNFVHKSRKIAKRWLDPKGSYLPVTFEIKNREMPDMCYTVEATYLWWTVSFDSSMVEKFTETGYVLKKDTVKIIHGTNLSDTTFIPAKIIGQDKGKRWNELGTAAFRAKIDSVVNKPGKYKININANSDWTDGLTMIMIYQDHLAEYEGHMIIKNGLRTIVDADTRDTLEFGPSEQYSESAKALMVISDLQKKEDDSTAYLTLNGKKKKVDRLFWNSEVWETTVNEGQDQSYFAVEGVSKDENIEAYSWALMGLYYQTDNPLCPRLLQFDEVKVKDYKYTVCKGDTTWIYIKGADYYELIPNPYLPEYYDILGDTIFVAPEIDSEYWINGYTNNRCDSGFIKVSFDVVDMPDFVLKDDTTCSGNPITIGIPPKEGYKYYWYPTYGLSNPGISNPEANPAFSLDYYLTVVNPSGCSTEKKMRLEITKEFSLEVVEEEYICRGEKTQLSAEAFDGSGKFAYHWEPDYNLSNNDTADPLAWPDDTTEYIVTATDMYSSCTMIDTVTVFVGGASVDIGPDLAICPGDTLSLLPIINDTISPVEYSWIFNGKEFSDSANPVFIPDTNGILCLEVKDASNCTVIDSIELTRFSDLYIELDDEINICKGDAIRLEPVFEGGSRPFTINWGPKYKISDPLAYNPVISPDKTITYYITVIDNLKCKFIDSVKVIVNDPPTVNAGPNLTICQGEEIPIEASYKGAIAKYSWAPADGLDDPEKAYPLASPNQTTSYIIKVEDQYGCFSIDTINLFVLAPEEPELVLIGDDSPCLCDSVILRAEGDFLSYNWSSGEKTKEICVKEPGVYKVETIDKNGCASSSQPKEISFRIPSAEIEIISDKEKGVAGDIVNIQVRLSDSENLRDCNIHTYDYSLSFDKRMLTPVKDNIISRIEDERQILDFNGVLSQDDDILNTLALKATFADTGNSEISIDKFNWIDCETETIIKNAFFELKDEFHADTSVSHLLIIQNPVTDRSIIYYKLTNDSNIELYISDLLGRRIATLSEAHHTKGSYEYVFEPKAYASGQYFLTLKTNTESISVLMQILR